VPTPALLLDLDAFEANLSTMQGLASASGIALRPHGKAHRCPQIARSQVAAGAAGICCQTIGEAECFSANGIEDLFITNVVSNPSKIARVANLAKSARVAICVDNLDAIAALSKAAVQAGVVIEALVELDVGDHRLGVSGTDQPITLAKSVASAPGLRFGGLQAYRGRIQHERDADERYRLAREAGEAAVRARHAINAAGVACPRVTGGGTGTSAADCELKLLDEIQPGSYVFMDGDYGRNQPRAGSPAFRHALTVLTEVISIAVEGQAVCDAGLKSFTTESGLPAIAVKPEWKALRASDEHLQIACSETRPALGDRLQLIPGHCDPTVNLHDRFVCVRKGRVEAIWPIDARGKSA
jgi:D-serine deaminase-like pyridoxal phosphate-dependent protein